MMYVWWTLGVWTVIAFALVIYDGCTFSQYKPVSIRCLILQQFLMLPFLLVMWLLGAVALLFLVTLRVRLGNGK